MNDVASTSTDESPSSGARGTSSEVCADLTFIVRASKKPVFESAAYTGGAPHVYFDTEQHSVAIRDLRQLSRPPVLDREGFELRHHASAVTDFYDDAQIHSRYYPEIEALLRTAYEATQVTVFDATRRSDSSAGARNRDGVRSPASCVHVDYTTKSGPQRARDALGAERVQQLLEQGARIVEVNVWRPIHGPVQRMPLAVADAASVRPEDLIATDQIFPNRVGQIYHLAYHSRQRWYYAPRMTPDEVLLIKGWDSLEDEVARFTPHGAFELPDTASNAPARESIELRTFVVIHR